MSEKQTGKQKSRKERKPRVLLDVSSFPHDEKGNAIVPDAFMDENYRNLPNGTRNESGTARVQNSGKLNIFGGDPEADRKIHRAGADASNAAQAQRKTFSEMLDIGLRKKTESGLTYLEAITVSMMQKAAAGDTKAAQFVRDTIGEMPVTRQEIKADVITDADRALIEKLSEKMGKRS